MAIRFIIGRAGSGKTHFCLEAIRGRLARDAVDGPRLVFLVPEQAALQMERAVLMPQGAPPAAESWAASHRAEVLSFRRLAYRVLESSDVPFTPALSDAARAMVLRQIVSRFRPRLRYYQRAAGVGRSGGRLGGFVNRLAATIAELMEEGVGPERLPGGPEADDAGSAADPAQAAKLHDLRLIYGGYLDYLGARRLDPSRHLEVARPLLARCGWLAGAEVWVDGFASFSGQELQTLVELAGLSASMDVTVLFDPQRCTSAGVPSTEGMDRLFRRTGETCAELVAALTAAGLTIEEPVLLAGDVLPRFRASRALQRLEQALFAEGEASGGAAAPSDIEVVELPTRRIEVDYAVSRICGWVQEGSGRYRYRDIALIVRDLEPYHELISAALGARNVPFFIDRRRPASHHPLVELLRGAAAMAAEDMPQEVVRTVLKTDLLPLAREAADGLENYLIAHGIEGLESWRGGDWTFRTFGAFDDEVRAGPVEAAEELRSVNAWRRRLLERFESWLGFAAEGEGHCGGEWTAALHRLLQHIKAGATMRRWAEEAQREGDFDQAEEHRQVWRQVMSFLDDLGEAFPDAVLTAGELADVLEAGLATLTLGLVPPTVDQVLVSSIERSRNPDIKAAVILGFTDGTFPLRAGEDSIFNDDDRSWLRAGQVRVGPPTRERVLDESLLLYIAVTRPSDALVVSYPTSDEEGTALRPSPYLGAVTAACPGLEVGSVGDPGRERRTWAVLSSHDLRERMAMEFGRRPGRSEDDVLIRGRWNALYELTRGSGGDRLERALAGLGDSAPVRVSGGRMRAFLGEPFRTSVSQLESYATCPFQFFSRFVLDLRKRPEAALEAVDVGRVHHAILEDFVGTLVDRRQAFGALSDAELLALLEESCARVMARVPSGGAVSDARSRYLLGRSRAQLARILRSQQQRAERSAARPAAVELPFGFEQSGSLPALGLTTPRGRRVLLRGYIDRVDLAELSDETLGVVIDYKRKRDKRLDLSDVYYGLSLQMLAYLLVLADAGQTLSGRPVRPIGALFVPLSEQYRAVAHPSQAGESEGAPAGGAGARGLLLFEKIEALDTSFEGGRSELYNVHRKQDGALGYPDSSDAAEGASFNAVLAHTKRKLGELADGVVEGDMAVRPYRLDTYSPCSWCPMPAVCRFEMGLSEVRFLEKLKRSDVLRRLGGGVAAEDPE